MVKIKTFEIMNESVSQFKNLIENADADLAKICGICCYAP